MEKFKPDSTEKNPQESSKLETSPNNKEKSQETVTFYIAEKSLDPHIFDVLSAEEYEQLDNEDLKNMNWERITVNNERDKQEWIDLKNESLRLAWIPNHIVNPRKRIEEIEERLSELEGEN